VDPEPGPHRLGERLADPGRPGDEIPPEPHDRQSDGDRGSGHRDAGDDRQRPPDDGDDARVQGGTRPTAVPARVPRILESNAHVGTSPLHGIKTFVHRSLDEPRDGQRLKPVVADALGMGLDEIIEAAERVGDRDADRQETFRSELSAFDRGETDEFAETREALAAEREALAALDEEIETELSNIDELVEQTEFLSADQAVRHREATVEKLEAHNERLRTFHDEMVAALDVVEENLDALEREGPEAVEGDPDPHFERAHEALEAHNETVEGLSTNLTILNAYLL
jgi:chemotaxis protein histidine kinase CheA